MNIKYHMSDNTDIQNRPPKIEYETAKLLKTGIRCQHNN